MIDKPDDFDTTDLRRKHEKRNAESEWPGSMYTHAEVGIDKDGYYKRVNGVRIPLDTKGLR